MMSREPARICTRIPVGRISPNPSQPRKTFSESAIDSLAVSISEHGLISPVLVRMVGAGSYELVAGERRLRAVKKLGMTTIDALVIPAYDLDSAVIALIENIQREQLSFLEEADACRAILEKHGMTQDALAKALGRSPSALANRLRLLKLPEAVRTEISRAALSERHARALLSVNDPSAQLVLAREAAEKPLTVRQLEQRIARMNRPAKNQSVKGLCRDVRLYVNAVRNAISQIESSGADAEMSVESTSEYTRITVDIRPRT